MTISCVAEDIVTLSPTTASISSAQFDQREGVSANFTITVKPYYINDWSTNGSRAYSVSCSATSTVLSNGGSDGGVYGGNTSVLVHTVHGTVFNSIYPTWQVGHGN